jgi:hypothetical protein
LTTTTVAPAAAPNYGTAAASLATGAGASRLVSLAAAETGQLTSPKSLLGRRLVAQNYDIPGAQDQARPTATKAQEQKIQSVMQLLRNAKNQALLAKDKGVVPTAGILTYFEGQGGIRTISNAMTTLDFYYKKPHTANLERMTSGVLSGESVTRGLTGVVPQKVQRMKVGDEVNYNASANTLADGLGKRDALGAKDAEFYGLLGAWTVADRASISVTKPNQSFYEVTVKSTTVGIDKYDWNTGPNDKNLVTTLYDITTGNDVPVNHAQMASAKKFGAKDFWLTGAQSTETKYRVPAQVMQNILYGGCWTLTPFKVSESSRPIADASALRTAITQAYKANTGQSRSAPVPAQAEPIRPLVFPDASKAPLPSSPGGSGGGTSGIKPTTH